jgi:hypothetical protein
MANEYGRERVCFAAFGKPVFFCYTIFLERVFTLGYLLRLSECSERLHAEHGQTVSRYVCRNGRVAWTLHCRLRLNLAQGYGAKE